MFMKLDKLQAELPEPKKPEPNAAAALQELLGGKYGEMSTLGNYMFQSFNFRNKTQAAAVLQPRLEHLRRGTRPRRARLDRHRDAEQRPGRRHRRASTSPRRRSTTCRTSGSPAASSSNGGGAMPINSNAASWNVDMVTTTGQPDHRPAAQLPPGMRRPPPQAARLRDPEGPDRPRGLRLPAGPRLGPRARLRAGAEEAHRRRDREDAADAEHRPRQDPRVPEVPRRRARTGASTRFSPDDYEEAAGVWSNDEVALPGDPPGNLEVVDGTARGRQDPGTRRQLRRLRAGLRAGGDLRDREQALQEEPLTFSREGQGDHATERGGTGRAPSSCPTASAESPAQGVTRPTAPSAPPGRRPAAPPWSSAGLGFGGTFGGFGWSTASLNQ